MSKFTKRTSLLLAVLAFIGTCGVFGISASAAEVGFVTDTDITVFIDNSPIESYNCKGDTYLVAEELLNYGFDVVWNAEDRTLSIDRKPYSYTAYIDDFVNVKKPAVQTYSYLFPIYSTDIVTYVDGEKADSCNIGGRTVIRADWLQKFGECIYDNEKRRFDVKIIENEASGLETKADTYDSEAPVGSNGYYKYEAVKKGRFAEDGTLLYGYTVENSTDRFGSYKTVTYINAENGSEYRFIDNFKQATRCTASYRTAKGNVSCAYDDSFRYGLVARVITEGDTETRYSTDGKRYLSVNTDSVIEDESGHTVSFTGTIYKDGKPVFDGEIFTERLVNVEAEYRGVRTPYDVYITYAPKYTDPDGVIYYYNDMYTLGSGGFSAGDSLYYRGNVVNGVAHGEGRAYYNGAIPGGNAYGDEYTLINEVSKFVVPRAMGGLMYVGDFANNLYNGRGKLYNREGMLSAEGAFRDGNINGMVRFYSNGVLEYIGEMKNGIRDGSGTEYSPKGIAEFEGLYASFAGTFRDGARYSGTEYIIKYNASENCHDVIKGAEWTDGASNEG